jgi:hypothetical protein
VQTTKGEDADNRIGDQVKTVCVVRGNQLYKREDGGEGEGKASWGRRFHFPTHEAASEQGDPGNVGLVAERVWKSKRPLEMIALLHSSPLHAGCDQLPVSRISHVRLPTSTQMRAHPCTDTLVSRSAQLVVRSVHIPCSISSIWGHCHRERGGLTFIKLILIGSR